MGRLTNALQGKLNIRPSQVKDSAGTQLELFSSLSEHMPSSPKIIISKPETPAHAKPEPEWVLPPPPPPAPRRTPPPDVTADVRAALSPSGAARPVSGEQDRSALRTGVYHRPQRPSPPPSTTPPTASSEPTSQISLLEKIRSWFSGVELSRRNLALILVAFVIVSIIGFWSAWPRGEGGAEQPSEMPEVFAQPTEPEAQRVEESVLVVQATVTPVEEPSPPPPTGSVLPVVSDWKILGTTILKSEKGGQYVRFNDPVFVSSDKISVEGMSGLKAVASKLLALKSGARVVVTGFTDDIPLSKPTDAFKSNEDIAAARAKAAVAHLESFARANKALVFETRTGDSAKAPFPNDSPQNRRLNRTVTVHVFPTP